MSPFMQTSGSIQVGKDELVFAKQLVREAGARFLYHFGHTAAVWTADNNPITAANHDISSLMNKRIARAFPGDAIVGVELSDFKQSSRIWAVNAIDGTQPYSCGLPLATISMALLVDGIPLIAVAYDPILGNLYYAQRGRGTHRNGHILHVSASLQAAQNFFVCHPVCRQGTPLLDISTMRSNVILAKPTTSAHLSTHQPKSPKESLPGLSSVKATPTILRPPPYSSPKPAAGLPTYPVGSLTSLTAPADSLLPTVRCTLVSSNI